MVGIVYGLLLSAFGTCLPAVAVGGDASFLEARRRGKHVFGYTAIRLFFCLGPAAALSFFSLFELVYYLSESGLLKEGQFFSLANVGVILFSSALGAFNTALTSTILSRAYLIGEDKRWEATARGPALSLA